MPLPPKSDPNCIGKTIKIEMALGKSKNQAIAIANNYCGKSNDKKKELEVLKNEIINEIEKIKKVLNNDE